MMRWALVVLFAVAPLAVHAQDAEPTEEEDGCFGTGDSPQKFAFRMACYAGACVGVSYFYIAPACRSARDAQAPARAGGREPRRGVGVGAEPEPVEPPHPDLLLTPHQLDDS